MKHISFRKLASFGAVLAAATLWLLFVIQVWNQGSATTLPFSVYYVYRHSNAAYTLSAGLPMLAFLLIWLLPDTVRSLCPKYDPWNIWYVSAAGILLTAQTLCMLPAWKPFVELLRDLLGYRASSVLNGMIACYVHTVPPVLGTSLLCALIRVAVSLLRRSKQENGAAVLKAGERLGCSIVIAFVLTVASCLLLGLMRALQIPSYASVQAFCRQNATVSKAAFISIVIAPLVEEIAFRGVICKGLAKHGGRLAAIFISALFFGLWHRNLGQFIYTFVWGILYGYLCLSSGSIAWTMLIHCLSNILAILAFSEASSAVLGAWPGLCAFRKWLLELPLWAILTLLALCTAAAVLCAKRFRYRKAK